MAIDGVKIIDSDSAHDIYNSIMEMYHYGKSIEDIRFQIDQLESDYSFNDLEIEIYTTSYALAMWEIGELTKEQLQKVRNLINKGVSPLWSKIGSQAQEKRKVELEKFLDKVTNPNPKVKKRKNYKLITDFIFEPNDVLIFKLDKKNYGAAILVNVYNDRGKGYYDFTEVILQTNEKPTLEMVKSSKVYARKNIGFDNPKTINHKDFLLFSDKFEKIGKVNIRKKDRQLGGISPKIDFKDFCDDWNWDGGRMKKKTYFLSEFLE